MTFKDVLVLWMAGFGMNQEQTDKVLNDPRMVANIESKDSGGVIIDIGALLINVDAGEAYTAIQSNQEKLLLMQLLKGK